VKQGVGVRGKYGHGVYIVGPLLRVSLRLILNGQIGYRSYGSSGVALFDRCDLPIQISTGTCHMFGLYLV